MTAHDLLDYHRAAGARLAPDGIPLDYGDLTAEYAAAQTGVLLLDRSHEGRLLLGDRDRLAILQRISTNDLEALPDHYAAPTVLLTPNGRIRDRLLVIRDGDRVWLLTEPGRGDTVADTLRRNLFFNDAMTITPQNSETRMLALHGGGAPALAEAIAPGLDLYELRRIDLDGVDAFILRDQTLVADGGHYRLIVAAADAVSAWQSLVIRGALPAGSLAYNCLRIRAGRPGVGRELSEDYIPLEVGLWDAISFTKGCYTGQEIIARMESRRRMAKTICRLLLDAPIDAPAPLMHEGKSAGMLTSSISAPDGIVYGIGVIKLSLANPGVNLSLTRTDGASVGARIIDRAGAQPADLNAE